MAVDAQRLIGSIVIALVVGLAAAPAVAQTTGGSVADHVTALKAPLEDDGETSRVIGGRMSEPGDRPWQVALASASELTDDPQSKYQAQFCGGSVLDPNWILTAAHCVVGEDGSPMAAQELVVLFGDVELTNAEVAAVERIVVHESYNSASFVGDIALVRLAAPLDLSGERIKAIGVADAAAERDHAAPGAHAIVSGWGRLEDGNFPLELREADIEIQEQAICERGLIELYKRQFKDMLDDVAWRLNVSEEAAAEAFQVVVDAAPDPIPDSMLCAGLESGKRDACNGDSGGPVVVRGAEGFVQVGIVSWGEVPIGVEIACGLPQLYGYYTRISSYKDWIDETTRPD
jgi:secreted trypsin-like serine protease